MGFFSSDTLTSLRTMATTARTGTATRYPRVSAYDATTAKTTVSWPFASGDAVAARLVPIAADERAAQDTTKAVATYRLALPITATVAATDRWVFAGTDLAGVAWSKTLEVVGIVGPHSAEVERIVECVEVAA